MSTKRKAFKKRVLKIVAVYLALSILFDALYPSAAWALTGGPSQPEVQSFEPVGTSDMVDLFSGDFKYNIPLIDVDGYPVNLSYNSGIGMDQEASWVGLGWNINAGVINRAMRGIPDDFRGDVITKEYNMKPNKTYGVNLGAGMELFGADKLKVGLDATLGVKYNNYNGIGIEKSLNVSLSAGQDGKGPFNGGLGITSSSDEGLTIQPRAGLQARMGKEDNATGVNLGLSVGTAFNSRAGLKQLSVNTNLSVSQRHTKGKRDPKKYDYGSSSISKAASANFNFGQSTYTPQINMPMQNLSVTARFTLGAELIGLHPHGSISGYYSSQKLIHNTVSNPAYGYMNADEGTKYDNAVLDFNREKDGSFSESTPALPVTNFTYDLYSVSGQGVGGSYRPFRGDIGHVYDAASYSTSDGYSIGGEVGLGNLNHYGADFSVNTVDSRSGRWSSGNPAATALTARTNTSNPLYERYYFKEANEKSVDADPAFINSAGGGLKAQHFELDQVSKFNTQADNIYVDRQGNTQNIPSANYRSKREKRSQAITTLTYDELLAYGLEVNPNLYAAPNHHIAEISTLGTDGSRYVYGIAAYNTKQEETTFAVGADMYDNGGYTGNCQSGLVTYNPGVDNSASNQLGLDNFYSNTITPAYAHSYMLTAVLSPDYVDADNVRGPSVGDLGSYTKFNYTKVTGYKWRTPVAVNSATYSEGLKFDRQDDKANYLYGEKDLWYLESIETKNYIAEFTTSPRKDGYGVTDKNGGLLNSAVQAMQKLDKISVYSKGDLNVPIKEVHFEYDYSLCPKVPNNIDYVNGATTNTGKLTLKRVYFTYQKSNKAKFSPYDFTYSSFNPDYNIKGYDRWGNYKPNTNADCTPLGIATNIPTAEYPYVEQDQTTADQYASAWTLKEITLPSGGKINVTYQSDDYAYVQNKRAMQMFRIVGTGDAGGTNMLPGPVELLSDENGNKNKVLFFDLTPGYTDINDYLDGVNELYFRALVKVTSNPDRYEYVSGYSKILNKGADAASGKGWIELKPVKLNDNGNADYNPITKAAIQFLRLNKPQWAWGTEISGEPSFGKQLLEAMLNSSFVQNIKDAIEGPNLSIYNNGHCHHAVMGKSWIRLNNVTKKKLGGGVRVTRIEMTDEWSGMTGAAEATSNYGQEYSYVLEDGTSSGVASYEPQLGGDENPWKQPVYFDEGKLLAPDDEHYMEEPFGEMFFPSASVGYSRVTVKNLQRTGVTRHATGKVVHEFYTAKDYPTITERTDLVHKQEKTDPLSLKSLFNIDVRDYMTATQGYLIELNDMHGKPKKEEVFQEGVTTPITSVEYKYKSTPYLNGSFRLDNTATVIENTGNITTASIGVFYDQVADMRESTSSTSSSTTMVNVDAFIIGPIGPLFLPIILPSVSKERTRFRSAVNTKVIQRFALLEETIAKDLGSKVSTRNLAYDAETGEVLVTQTKTNFEDDIYSFTYPAHWYYDGMGPAYRNIGFVKAGLSFPNGSASVTNAPAYFAEGDELGLFYNGNTVKGWVTQVTPTSITVVMKDGTPVTGTWHAKVLRSGRRNLQVLPIATITSLANPLDNFNGNIFNNVLQATANEYSNQWRTYCDCFITGGNNLDFTTNPYVLGIKGNWKLKKSYLHLTERTQSNYNNNTNIRKDGMFRSFTPFFKLSAGKWVMDDRNWTYTSEVTEFSPHGPELENKDALGRFSAATFGYNQMYSTSVAANSRYRDIGTDNFEDYSFSPCADNHFKLNDPSGLNIVTTQSHSGRNSVKVSSGAPANLTRQLVDCPPEGCVLTIQQTLVSGVYTLTATGGEGPYTIDWNVLNGNPDVQFSNTGDGLVISGPAGSSVEVTITDSKGCRATQLLTW